MKISLSLGAIAVTLLVSSILSIMEYTRMSNYVSELIADDIRCINVAQSMSNIVSDYNLELLASIGDNEKAENIRHEQFEFISHCDSLKNVLSLNSMEHLADSVARSYSSYMLTSMDVSEVMESDFVDTRKWYFETLQPKYVRLHLDIETMSEAIYNQLRRNSATFERGFYRSIIPGAVAVAVGLMLILMLLFFLLTYYVNPIHKMHAALCNYLSFRKMYNYDFDGDDQLKEMNDNIAEVCEENRKLRTRIKLLRETLGHKPEA